MALPTETIPATHARAVQQAGELIAGVRPDQLGAPTPCAQWTVRDVINHVVAVTHGFSRVAAGEKLDRQRDVPDLLGDDPAGAYTRAAAETSAAFAAPGALERSWTLFFGDVPGAVVQGIHAVDLSAHAWDIARATGQMDRLDPDLGAAVLEIARGIVRPDFRNEAGDPFRPEVAVAGDAPGFDRLAGYLGRQP